ncbi:MAG: SusF/SusE family outer membrane protein [Bacteroidales bacterium]|nr:SusF/SusE family outer membrane protein [Bacteroidales bacterium]
MKKIFAYIATVAIFAACAKESPVTQERPITRPHSSGTEMILHASIPPMTDATKANAIGSFTWADGDKIAIPVEGGYVDFTFSEADDAFKYTLTGSESFIDGTAYYPANSKPGGDYSTAFASPEAAKAGFKMEAPFTVGSEDITFTHKSAIIKLHFTGVPTTATGVRVLEEETEIATIALSNPSADLEVYVPITPNGSKKYRFALMQYNTALREVGKSSVALTAGTYYTSKDIAFAISELYLLGGATDNGWSLETMPQLTKEGNVFSIKANLTAYNSDNNNRFRFPLQRVGGTWWPCLVKGDADGTVKIGDSDYYDGDHFTVSEDGYYQITIDVSAMTYTITRLGSKRYEITELYLNGDACDTGWNASGVAPLTQAGNVFSTSANLYAGKTFRLNTQKVDWWPAIVKDKATGEPVYCASQGVWDNHSTVWEHFSVAEDGFYEIVFDADAWTLTLTRKNDIALNVSDLYLIGDATDIGWSITDMPQFTKNGYEFTLTAHLKTKGIFRFLTQKEAGVWYPALVKGGTTGTVKYAAADATNDEHFTVDKDGIYLITVNTGTRTYSITLQEEVNWYVVGNVYATDPTQTGWDKAYAVPMTETSPGIWEVTVNITGEFKLSCHSASTDLWTYGNLGLWAAGSLSTEISYGLLSNGENIGIQTPGRYALKLEPANTQYANLLTGNKID